MYNQEKFLLKLQKNFGMKYDYSKVNYKGYYDYVTLICPEHGEFKQRANLLINGYGCEKCREKENNNKLKKKRLINFIKRAREIHGNKYDYSKVNYINYGTKVCIICPEHGEFWQTPHQHISKYEQHGCPTCGKVKSNKLKLTTEEFIKKAREVHGNKYDYSKVEYINCDTKVCIICPEHGEFWQTPYEHTIGHGCPKCRYKKLANKLKLTTEEFIERVKKIHGDKYDYSEINYVNTKTPVTLICPEHGKFLATPKKLLSSKCPCDKCKVAYSKVVYSYEYCLELSKKYDSQYEFRREQTYAYNKSKKENWLKDFVWLNLLSTEKADTLKIQCVYVYEFSDGSAYIGLTNNINRRDKQHRLLKSKHGEKIIETVLEHSIKYNLQIPKPKILEKNLTRPQSKNKEIKWIEYYRKNGWKILNKVKGGSLGAPLTDDKCSENEIIEEAKKYKTMEEMRRESKTIYRRMIRLGLKYVCFPNAHFIENMKKPNQYTEEFLINITTKYPTKTILRKNEYRVFRYLYNHGLLEKYYGS